MKIVVTGAAGFVGSHICEQLLAAGHDVHGLDNMSSGVDLMPSGVRRYGCDLAANLSTIDISDANVIVHAAAYAELRHNWDGPDGGRGERARLFRNNELATKELLEHAPPSAAFIFLSSASVYGSLCMRSPGLSVCETDAQPETIESPYAASKLACESFVAAYSYKTRRRWFALRLVNQVGSRTHRGVIADFVRMARTGRIHAADDGEQRKSWVHVEDTAGAIREIVALVQEDDAPDSGVYNVTSKERWSWRDIVRIMREGPGAPHFDLTWEHRPGGAVGDPIDLNVSSRKLDSIYECERHVRIGVRDALRTLGWPT